MIADPFIVSKYESNIQHNRCIECQQCQYLKFNKLSLSCPIYDWK